jgi:phosphoenolpyruvate carboxykinase (ATP)
VDFDQYTITENTRASYPIEYIANAHIPCTADHPSNIIFLTCDAYGVLPPVCRLTPEQASYYFISGYTAKVAGTEMGVTEPTATFSACFGAAFMPWHHNKYAELLSNKIHDHKAHAWMVNTGWTGGGYGTGNRISLKYTRAIIDAIHEGAFEQISFCKDPVFGFEIPVSCPNVPNEILTPENTWKDKEAFIHTQQKVANLFRQNFSSFANGVNPEIVAAGPQ